MIPPRRGRSLFTMLLFIPAACADIGVGTTPERRDGADGGPPPDAVLEVCNTTLDCGVGHECQGGLCQPMVDVTSHLECVRDSDCPHGFTCDEAVGLCTDQVPAGPGPDDTNSDNISHPGDALACYVGQSRICGVSKVGECRWGLEACTSGNTWAGVCEGAVLPATDVCDYRDNDCDGAIDEDYDVLSDVRNCSVCGRACSFAHAGASCLLGGCVMGDCQSDWWNLDGRSETGCEYPCQFTGGEVCDGKDNDCDGTIDGIGRNCYTGPGGTRDVGVCHGGGQTCAAGVWSACGGQVLPEAEECNDADDDCDGSIDGIVESCYRGPNGSSGVGACAPGSRLCLAGSWGQCAGDVLPTAESCNNDDDDCDGVVDGVLETCYTGPAGTRDVGLCRGGTQTCSGGGWGACTNQIRPATETCDAKDEDCDGVTDRISQSCYTGPNGTQNRGECKGGSRTCALGGWGSCGGEVVPALEACNSKDDNCDGVTDSFPRSCYTGTAGTAGVGICKTGTQTCTNGNFLACTGQVTPLAEACDGIDNDCNGTVDDGCLCVDGSQIPCYGGPAGTQGVGICTAGTQLCSSGAWGLCIGQVLPGTEECDGADNDCDAVTDGLTLSCYDGLAGTQGVGLCQGGTMTCTAGAWGGCVGQVVPAFESCDGADNDCNGVADQISRTCYNGAAGTAGVGQCRSGTQMCNGGAWGACAGEVIPATEVCDGLDNDCSGLADAYTESCYAGPAGTANKGECKAGSRLCASGAWGSCGGQVTPVGEVCNSRDDDCDSATDESLTQTCYGGPSGTAGVGLCRQGTQTCAAGGWGTCAGEVVPAAEACDDRDNNCDGTVDGIVQSCYAGPAGTAGVGECKAGSQTCTTGNWGACNGQVTPVGEICNSRDDDCNGVRDNISQTCYAGPAGTRGVGECREGSQLCTNGSFGSCNGQVVPSSESCDARDNDCDAATDEALSQACYSGPNGTNGVGECKAGAQTCAAGAWGSCAGQVTPLSESCNNKDDDCDGTRDESLTQSCYSGAAGTQGVGECRGGTQTCSAGAYGACIGQVTPVAEVCDVRDNDCDARSDEGFDNDADNYTTCGGDCADNDPTRHPGATELCNGLDDDCDGAFDEGTNAPNFSAGPDLNAAPLSVANINGTVTGCGAGGASCTYTWTIQSQPSGAAAIVTGNRATATLTNLDTAGDYTVCGVATNSVGCALQDCMVVHVVPIEDIHVELFFADAEIDFDLHYLAPGNPGNLAIPQCGTGTEPERVVSFCNRTGEWGSNPAWSQNTVLTDDPSLDKDVLRGPGTENMNHDNPFNGVYPVKVHYFCDCVDFSGPNCRLRVGAKATRVRIFTGGVMRNEWTRTLDYNDLWYVADVTANNGAMSITARNSVSKAARGCFGP